MFAGIKHFVACFQDVMLEVICKDFRLEARDLVAIVQQQLAYLE